MTKLSANDFRSICDSVVYALDSLSSCSGQHERERELARVVRNADELRGAVLARKNADCESYRSMVLRRADDAIQGDKDRRAALELSDASVVARLAEIRAAAAEGDHETAHILDDKLREDVLLAVALGNPEAPQLARRALASKSFDFHRHCA